MKAILQQRRRSLACDRELSGGSEAGNDLRLTSFRSVHTMHRVLPRRRSCDVTAMSSGGLRAPTCSTSLSISRSSDDLSAGGVCPPSQSTPKQSLFRRSNSQLAPLLSHNPSEDFGDDHGGKLTTVTPEALQEKLNAYVEANNNFTPPTGERVRKMSPARSTPLGDYAPSLPPIQGTPVNTLRRRPLEVDSGIENVDFTESFSPAILRRSRGETTCSNDLTRSLKHAPRRCHQEKGMITSASRLPFSDFCRKSKKLRGDTTDGCDAPPNSPFRSSQAKESTSNPAQLVRHLFFRRKKNKKKRKHSSLTPERNALKSSPISPFHLDSSIYLDVSSSDSYTITQSGGQFDPKSDSQSGLQSDPQSALQSGAQSDPQSGAHLHQLLLEGDPVSDGASSVPAFFAEVPFTFGKSFGIVTPDTSAALQDSTELDASLMSDASYTSSAVTTPASWSRRSSVAIEETDGGWALEESEVDQKPIRVLDISSNLLLSLSDLAAGGAVLLSRLREVERLDLRKNLLKMLPRELMEVGVT